MSEDSAFTSPSTNWDPPIYFINDGFNAEDPAGPKATYQIVNANDEGVNPSPGSLNDSMFKGDVNCPDTASCPTNKVIIKFQDFTFQDPENDVGDDLWNVPINQIEYVEYDFYPISCPGDAMACPGEFYISFYTHLKNNGYPLENPDNWYNCRYGFGPNGTTPPKVGNGAVGEWSTFRVNPEYFGRTIGKKGDPDDCNDTTALKDITSDNLLGSNLLEPTIFILNMGQSTASDNGLSGYFDNVRIKIKGQDLRVYDL